MAESEVANIVLDLRRRVEALEAEVALRRRRSELGTFVRHAFRGFIGKRKKPKVSKKTSTPSPPAGLGLREAIGAAESASSARKWSAAARLWAEIVHTHGARAPAKAYSRLARANRGRNDLAAAAKAVADGIRLHPNEISLLIESAELASLAKDWHEAIRRWELVLAKPNPPLGAYIGLARGHIAIGDWEGADRITAQALRFNEENSQLLSIRGEVAFQRSDFLTAQSLYEKIAQHPSISDDQRNDATIDSVLASQLLDSANLRLRLAERAIRPQDARRIAIYNAIIGGYDDLKLPRVLMDNCDYVVFTDSPIVAPDLFKIRPPHS